MNHTDFYCGLYVHVCSVHSTVSAFYHFKTSVYISWLFIFFICIFTISWYVIYLDLYILSYSHFNSYVLKSHWYVFLYGLCFCLLFRKDFWNLQVINICIPLILRNFYIFLLSIWNVLRMIKMTASCPQIFIIPFFHNKKTLS